MLLSEAVAALRELVARARDANDRSFDDGHSVDAWKSDELGAAIERAEAVIAKAEAAIAELQSRSSPSRRIATRDS
ncbi:hypothetical protein [Bradyrhizobium valentinum]|uniref:Uncharacterized protein n=1 Tax=Bradyrhizobium valentinum TaxID=1518501 RepID=A0A0R3L9L9_9BRAD|nr:hypothetical protein [Bradyrhizobium valentinum]KRR04363.1 hypothetical protein CP49_21490 [Bradyrhizobium valentinum]